MANKLWHGLEMEEFDLHGHPAKLVYPEGTPNGKLLLKTEYWDAFPDFEIAMVKRGYYLCHVQHFNRWATEDEVDIMAELVKLVAEKLNIEPKCIPVGMSCGGLEALMLAEKYPELISVLYIDAPVANLISMAGLGAIEEHADLFWKELVAAHGFTKSSIVTYRNSPIDHLDVLTDNNIPLIMLYGDADTTVIYEENGKVIENHYKAKGTPLKVIAKPMCGHHPHGLDDPTPIIEFVEKYC